MNQVGFRKSYLRVLKERERGRRGEDSGGGGGGGEAAQRGGNEVMREVTSNRKSAEEKLKLFRQRLQMEITGEAWP